MFFRIFSFLKTRLLTSISALLFLLNSAFATFPEPDELAKMIRSGNSHAIFRAIEDYENELNQASDQLAHHHQKPIKSAEEKSVFFKRKMKDKLNLQDSDGFTPLQKAAIFATRFSPDDFRKLVAVLVQNGADPRSPFRQKEGTRILYPAHLLILGDPPANLLIRTERLPIEYVHTFLAETQLNGKDLDTLSHVIDGTKSKDISLLYGHIESGSLSIAQVLLEAGANPNLGLRDEPKNTPLKLLLGRIRKDKPRPNSIQLAETLIRKGADPREELAKAFSSEQLHGSRELFQAMMEASLDSPILEIREWANEYQKRKLEDLEDQKEAEKTFLRWLDQQEAQERAEKVSALSRFIAPSMEENIPRALEKEALPGQADGKELQENTLQEPALEGSSEKDQPLRKRGSFSKDEKSKDHGRPYQPEEIQGEEWIVVKGDGNHRPKPRSPFRLETPFQVKVNGRPIDVVVSDRFEKHIQERQREVGGHDLTPGEIFHVLDSPIVVLQKDARHSDHKKIRYVFFALVTSGQFAQVVISKGPGDPYFQAVTAYKLDRLY